MAGAISDQTTNLSNLALTGRASIDSGPIFSGITADFRTNAVRLSLATAADASGLTTGFLGIVFQASGISLIYSSGETSYVLGQSAQSAAGS